MTKRRLLVDSCLPRALSERLRAAGHDVVAISERGADPGDLAILAIAAREGRFIVTADTDFGTLVFRDGAERVGVLRLRVGSAGAMSDRADALISAHGDALEEGAFVTDDGVTVRVAPKS